MASSFWVASVALGQDSLTWRSSASKFCSARPCFNPQHNQPLTTFSKKEKEITRFKSGFWKGLTIRFSTDANFNDEITIKEDDSHSATQVTPLSEVGSRPGAPFPNISGIDFTSDTTPVLLLYQTGRRPTGCILPTGYNDLSIDKKTRVIDTKIRAVIRDLRGAKRAVRSINSLVYCLEKEEDGAHRGYSGGYLAADIHRMAVKERFPRELIDYLLLMAELRMAKKKDLVFRVPED